MTDEDTVDIGCFTATVRTLNDHCDRDYTPDCLEYLHRSSRATLLSRSFSPPLSQLVLSVRRRFRPAASYLWGRRPSKQVRKAWQNMPFKLNYTAATGATYPASWWIVGGILLDRMTQQGRLFLHIYASKAEFDAGSPPLDSPIIHVTELDMYNEFFGAAERNNSAAWTTILEGLALQPQRARSLYRQTSIPEDLVQFADIPITLAEIGLVSSDIVTITFASEVQSAGDLVDGVTIKINGLAVLGLTVEQIATNVIRYTLPSPVGLTDVLTLEYDGDVGTITDVNGLPLASIAAKPITNYLGCIMNFSLAENSGLVAAVL